MLLHVYGVIVKHRASGTVAGFETRFVTLSSPPGRANENRGLERDDDDDAALFSSATECLCSATNA